MERLTLRTAKSWGGVPVRGWQEEWSPRSSSRWHEALDERVQQVSFNHQQKDCRGRATWRRFKALENREAAAGPGIWQVLLVPAQHYPGLGFTSCPHFPSTKSLTHERPSPRKPQSCPFWFTEDFQLSPFSGSVISLCFMSLLFLEKWEI